MLDALSEQLVTLANASKLLPPRRNGKRPNASTLYKWATLGVKGVILETAQIGGTRCTSREALQRFIDRLTTQAASNPAPAPTPRVDRRAVKRAERMLDAAGI